MQQVVQLVGVARRRARPPRARASIASGSRRARSRALDRAARGASCTARVRRSSSGASSRNVNGRPFRISCESGDGSVVSRAMHVRSRRASMPREQRAQPVDVHRLVQAVVQRLAHERVIGDLDRPGRGSPGTAPAPGTPPPSGRRPPCAGSAAGSCGRRGSAAPRARASRFQRQRAVNIGDAQHGLRRASRAAVGAQHADDARRAGSCAAGRARARSRRRSPPPGARSRRCGRTACAAARPERAVDPRAERRVHDELHAAALVEEALDARSRRRVGSAPSAVARRGQVGDDLRGARGVDAALAPAATARGPGGVACHELRAPTSLAQRRHLVARAPSVRAGASPSQNGTVGGAPCASRRARRPPRPAGSATRWCRAGRRRRPCSRSPSPRSRCRPTVSSGSATTR